MESDKQLATVSNGLFLAAGGVAVLLFRGLFLILPIRIVLAGAVAVWGVYTLMKNPDNKTPAYASFGASALLIFFGGLLRGLTSIAGIGMIIAGGVSWISGWLKRRNTQYE